jgi:glutamate carboxypeptidase
MLEDLRRLVELDSPTGHAALLSRTAEWLRHHLSRLGRVELVTTVAGRAPHVLLEHGPVGEDAAPLVLCHYDTVWPEGTAARRPFHVDGDWALGPGVLDMKASIVLVAHALRALEAHGMGPSRGVRVLITADEEIGNPTSTNLIVELARRASCALVMEPPLADGRLKTSRKGYGRLRVSAEGRAAHAGIEPEHGVNAAVEAAHVARVADALNDPDAGTSVTVGVLRAGEYSNVVPASGEVEIDVRAVSDAEMKRVLRTFRSLQPTVPGARLHLHVDVLRLPMPRVPQTGALVEVARRVGAGLGMEIREGHTGGVSEGNLTQAAGAPTLDGLGVVGIGPHTPDERILLSSLFERTALLAGMLIELGSVAPTEAR